MCSLCNSSYMVIENRVHAFTYIHSYFSSRFSASKIACGDITFITGISVNFNSLISHLVCFGLALDVSKGGKNHYWNDILVDCCILYHIGKNPYWNTAPIDCCIILILPIQIYPYTLFISCHLFVVSFTYHPSWLIVVWHISYWKNPYWNTAPIDCCIILILPIQIYPCALFISCHLFVVSFLYYPSCWLIVVWHISYWKNHYWNTAPIDCCIMLILPIQIYPYTLFISCHLFVVSFTYHPSWLIVVLTYIILVCPVYDRHHVANGWLIVASFNLCIHFDCCIISSLVHLSNPRSTKSKQ